MKICILRHARYPHCVRVSKEARALAEGGHQVDVICLKGNGQPLREIEGNINIYRIPLSHKRGKYFRYFYEYAVSFLFMKICLLFLYLRNRYDAIQVNTMPDFLVFATIIPKLLGAKIVLDLHEPTPELWTTKFGNGRLKFLLPIQQKIEQSAIKYSDQALTVTEKLRQTYKQRGADIEKITVIPNVCDENLFSFQENLSSWATSKFIVITHGLIEKRYGHELVIRAVHELSKSLPNIHFNVLGDGEYQQTAQRLVYELDCANRVHFLGFVPFNVLLKKIHEADVGVISMYRTPYSELIDTNKMYEYIALRKPVIVPRLPAIEDNFDDDSLMFFEPGNYQDLARCIRELYTQPEKRKSLVKNAYARYDMVRWSKTKHRYLKVVSEMVGKNE